MIPAVYNLSMKKEFDIMNIKVYSNIVKTKTRTNIEHIIDRSMDTFILDSIKIKSIDNFKKIVFSIGGNKIWKIFKEALICISELQEVKDGYILRFDEKMLSNQEIQLISCQYMNLSIKIISDKNEDAIIYLKNFYYDNCDRHKLATADKAQLIQQFQTFKNQKGEIWKLDTKLQCHGLLLDIDGYFNEMTLKVKEFDILNYDYDDLNYYGKLLHKCKIRLKDLTFLNKFIPDDVISIIYEYTTKINHKYWIPFHPKSKLNNYKSDLTSIDFSKINETEIIFDQDVKGNVTFINYNILINQSGMIGVYYK